MCIRDRGGESGSASATRGLDPPPPTRSSPTPAWPEGSARGGCPGRTCPKSGPQRATKSPSRPQ
eukprot:11583170-Alexandrium_andersonii.AAC.1